jgi:hypothetical protein
MHEHPSSDDDAHASANGGRRPNGVGDSKTGSVSLEGRKRRAPAAAGPTPAEIDAGFEEFYRHYPRKEAPAKAKRAYIAIVTGKHKERMLRGTIAQLLAAVKRYKPTCERQYIPHPASWLNAGAWLDGATQPNADTAKAQADFEAIFDRLRAEEDEGWRQ